MYYLGRGWGRAKVEKEEGTSVIRTQLLSVMNASSGPEWATGRWKRRKAKRKIETKRGERKVNVASMY